jgi:hypothetical protein
VRLDRAGEFIICGSPRGAGWCGGRIARIQPDDGRRVLLALPGWHRGDDGIWHEPPNDFARRTRFGHGARALPKKVTGTHNAGPSWASPMFADGPERFRCPDCQTVQSIAPAQFGLGLAAFSMITEPRS